ncbi:MAG: serine protease [Longispora sp.]|nr:serine protease [Longispora sp. (in: high G+C Gram-positive bacteria)]
MKLRARGIRALIGAVAVAAGLVVGASPAEAINHGRESELYNFPGLVGVSNSKTRDHVCGGTLIASDAVLTAAHCVVTVDRSTSPRELRVRVGSNNASSGGKLIEVKRINVHPGFAPTLQGPDDYDLAVLHLKHRVESKVMKPAVLATTSPRAGDKLTAAGWGNDDANHQVQQLPAKLRAVNLTVLSHNECKLKLKGDLYPNMRCAQSKSDIHAGYGQGDSGGPNYVNGKVVGVTSWQEDGKPAVFSSAYSGRAHKWVTKFLKGH